MDMSESAIRDGRDAVDSGLTVGQGALVTVILPCYNHEQYVERSVLSVFEQTYPWVQLVVIDDGSKDSSVERLLALKRRFDFTLICQENSGICRTLNRAIRTAARGEYIALLASDDFWDRDKLRLQMDELRRRHGSEFCFSQAIEFSDDENVANGRVFPRRCISGDVLDRVFIRQHVPAGTMLFSRRLYDQLGGFDENLKEEDWDFVIRSAAVTRFSSVNLPLLCYRSHQGNTMKARSRSEIFHQKARLLSKNFDLVSPWRWLLAITLHFGHDIVFSALTRDR